MVLGKKEQYNCERLEAVGLVCGRVQTDLDIGELSSINGGHFRKKQTNFASESLNIFRIDEVLCAVAWYAKWAN